MRVYIQWATATPQDWQPYEINRSAHVMALTKRGVPQGGEQLDDQPGWLCGLNCQGIDFSGWDHLAIEVVTDGLRITGWEDDPDDHGETRWAVEWTLRSCKPDPRIGGQMNTDQTRRVWATPDAAIWFPTTNVLPWEDFVPPPTNLTLHGIWMTNEHYVAHRGARSSHGWREWIS